MLGKHTQSGLYGFRAHRGRRRLHRRESRYLRSFADARIRLLELPHDYIGTLNRMLAEVRGRYICRMDADDLMMPGRLRCQFEYMEAHPKVDVWCGGLCY